MEPVYLTVMDVAVLAYGEKLGRGKINWTKLSRSAIINREDSTECKDLLRMCKFYLTNYTVWAIMKVRTEVTTQLSQGLELKSELSDKNQRVKSLI
jgi:hypothetical protein